MKNYSLRFSSASNCKINGINGELPALLSSFVKIKEKDDLIRELRITVPEDLNYAHTFDDLFENYTNSVKLVTVKTTNMGSLYKLVYKIQLKDEENIQSFIDDLRCRNGNLEIAIAIPAVAESIL